ncbi:MULTISPECIES: hypothetical protein [Saccharopolyspora]|uniref:Uncharacterized protein n=1 Tax=Saccharopolyspora cebuensis TaxID=418759 RepID=A0ABV4CEX4_9PSEU
MPRVDASWLTAVVALIAAVFVVLVGGEGVEVDTGHPATYPGRVTTQP